MSTKDSHFEKVKMEHWLWKILFEIIFEGLSSSLLSCSSSSSSASCRFVEHFFLTCFKFHRRTLDCQPPWHLLMTKKGSQPWQQSPARVLLQRLGFWHASPETIAKHTGIATLPKSPTTVKSNWLKLSESFSATMTLILMETNSRNCKM